LAAITGRNDFKQAAEATLRMFSARLEKLPQAVPYLLQALDFFLEEPRRVVIAGSPDSANFRELLRGAHLVYQPNQIVLSNTGAVEEFARTLPAKDAAVAYLCSGQSCQPPTNDPEKLKALLRKA
jgi:uncharacterized protein